MVNLLQKIWIYPLLFLHFEKSNFSDFWDPLKLFLEMQTSAFLRPLPPHVCKCLQLGTPSPPKNCGRSLWTAPNFSSKSLIWPFPPNKDKLALTLEWSLSQEQVAKAQKPYLSLSGPQRFLDPPSVQMIHSRSLLQSQSYQN